MPINAISPIRIVLWMLGLKAKAFEAGASSPMRAQERTLFEYLGRNKNTEFGLKHGFAGIRSVRDYQERVPLGDGESFRPYIERMARGENNILTADKPDFFAITSGTTSKPKLIPMTPYSRAKKTEVTALWSYYIYRDHPDVLDGKVLAVISHEIEGFTPSGIPYGAESGHAYRNLPRSIMGLYVLPYEVFEIGDYDARYYAILRFAVQENVSMIATLNPLMLVILFQRLAAASERIIQDIEKGTIDKGLDIPRDVREKLERSLKPDPLRAEELRRIVRERGGLAPRYFWPGLRLIACWKSGAAKLYLREFSRWFEGVPVRDFGYVSSESRSSVATGDEGAGSILAISTNFYEFIPKEDAEKEKKRIFLCDGVEKGKEYFIVVTTPGGLYRYNIDDVVKVTGFFKGTPVIEFVQKGLSALSIAGEKLYASHVDEAVNAALARRGISVKFFSAFPEFLNPPRYIVVLEFEKDPPPGVKKELLVDIEQGLCAQNPEYRLTREKKLLGSAALRIVKKGGFEKYRSKKIRGGAHDTQFKVPGLSTDPGFGGNFEIEEEISPDAAR